MTGGRTTLIGAVEDHSVCLTSIRALCHADCLANLVSPSPDGARVFLVRGSVSSVPAQGSRPATPGYRAAVRAQSPAVPAAGRPISQ